MYMCVCVSVISAVEEASLGLGSLEGWEDSQEEGHVYGKNSLERRGSQLAARGTGLGTAQGLEAEVRGAPGQLAAAGKCPEGLEYGARCSDVILA